MLVTLGLDIPGSQQIKWQRVDAVFQFIDFVDWHRGLITNGIKLSHRVINISGEALSHWACQRIDRGTE